MDSELLQGLDEDSELLLLHVTQQLFEGSAMNLELILLVAELNSLVSSMELNSPLETELMSLIDQTISVFNSMDLDPKPRPLQEIISLLYDYSMNWSSCWRLQFQLRSLFRKIFTLESEPELSSSIGSSKDSESELISLVTQLLFLDWEKDLEAFLSVATQIISLVSSIDWNLQPKPETELMSLITKTISVFNSIIDLSSQPEALSQLILLFYANYMEPYSSGNLKLKFNSLFCHILTLEPKPDLISLIHKIFRVIISTNSKSVKFISLYPQKRVVLRKGTFHVKEEDKWSGNAEEWECFPGKWLKFEYPEDDTIYFRCVGCNGDNHKEYNNATVEIQHYLHRNHSLQLVLLDEYTRTRECYCCDEDLKGLFSCCMLCDFAMNNACLKKEVALSIDQPKWHEHTLALFPRQAFLACNLCGLADARSPIYMCPPCDFVLHQKCINLPRVIGISRHHHRISFTYSFDRGVFSCGVCRINICNNYGGYSCIKEGCSYAVHSRCATQTNVWDGQELEGEPEEDEEEDIEEVEPFVRISEGIIQHFSHQHHHLKLDEDTNRDYDENKECQACITPIYFGNFYSCMQCGFLLHEVCANLSRKMHHPIHPHLLSLGFDSDVDYTTICTACPRLRIDGFFYKCRKEKCYFNLHVQCATNSEPLVHESHMHPLFLTSKPDEEQRTCAVCKELKYFGSNETFNCIVCDFALCFKCATLPQTLRYKHDKHTLSLSYGKETSTMIYWCEVCEGKIDPSERFYVCDEYCCVTIHVECLLGQDLYMKAGSSWTTIGEQASILPNNHHMTRPICSFCKKRCPHKTALQWSGSIFCSSICIYKSLRRE